MYILLLIRDLVCIWQTTFFSITGLELNINENNIHRNIFKAICTLQSEVNWKYGILISESLSTIRFFNEHKNRMPPSGFIRLWSDAISLDYFCKQGRTADATRACNPGLIKLVYWLCSTILQRVKILQDKIVSFAVTYIIQCTYM